MDFSGKVGEAGWFREVAAQWRMKLLANGRGGRQDGVVEPDRMGSTERRRECDCASQTGDRGCEMALWWPCRLERRMRNR
jgi:hypothetical protein